MDFFGRPDRVPMMLELLAGAKLKTDQQSTVRQDIQSSSSINDFELFIELEAVAGGIEVFEPTAVNGLLQTEAYARELIAYHASITLGVNVEESTALRLRRQSVITREASRANTVVRRRGAGAATAGRQPHRDGRPA